MIENREEKIQLLKNQIKNEDLQIFQHNLFIEAAAGGTTGNDVADVGLKNQADQAESYIAAATRRLAVYNKRLASLTAEAPAPSEASPPVGAP